MSQRSLFETPGAGRPNQVIEAGAGTGKTTRIVRDVLLLLLERPELNPSRIVLMTFTEKAAGEIASRIRAAIVQIRQVLESGGSCWPSESSPIITISPQNRDVALAASLRHSAQLEAIRSQTIHAFCQSILRGFPIESGVDPGFGIVEGPERRRLFDRTFDSWIDAELRDADEEYAALWSAALRGGRGTDALRAAFQVLYPRRSILADPSRSTGTFDELRVWVEQRLTEIVTLEAAFLQSKSDPLLGRLVELARSHPQLSSDRDWDEFTVKIGQLRTLSKAKLPKDSVARQAWGDLKKMVDDDVVANHRKASAYRALALRFFDALDREKARASLLEFDDLLDRTASLLRDPEVRAKVRRRFDYFFVDEFQDTDRVQAEILDHLVRGDDGRLAEGRITLVGDPKQSIYSFRRAEPEIFHRVSERYAAEGAVRESLDVQYRSDPSLVDAINAMFAKLLGLHARRVGPAVQPQYTVLAPGRTRDKRSLDARIRFLGVESSANDDPVRKEAEAVAEWIIRNRSQAERSADGDLRRFAILTRKLTRSSVWADVFARRGVELALPPSADLLAQRGSSDVIAVLSAIADPLDRGSLHSASRSVLIGLADNEIARGMAGEALAEWQYAQSLLRHWRRESRQAGTARLIRQIVDDAHLETSLRLVTGGDRWLARIHRLHEIAAEFDYSTGGSVRELLRELKRRREESAESEPAQPDEGINAVRLMSIHSSKGLEFDTVILPELGSQTPGGGIDAFTLDEPRELVLENPSTLNRLILRVDDHSLKEIQKQRREWERDRLFYVGVTRARTDVVFVAPVYPTAESGPEQPRIAHLQKQTQFWIPIREIFGIEHKTLSSRLPGSVSEEITQLTIGDAQVPIAFERARPDVGSDLRSRFLHGLDASVLRRQAEVFETVHAPPRDRERARRLNASHRRRWGTAVHRGLELLLDRSPESAVAQVTREVRLEVDDERRLQELILRVPASQTWRRIRNGTLIGAELPLLAAAEKGYDEKRLDLLVRESTGRLLVIDYKTGDPSPERIEEDSAQVRAYCARVSAMTNEASSGLLWYVERNAALEVTADTVISVEGALPAAAPPSPAL